MIGSNFNLNKWKNESLHYFKDYLDTLDKDSRLYKTFEQKIRELETM